MSWVTGADNVNFLKKRFDVLTDNPLFDGMEFSDDPETLKEWIPVMMENRDVNEPVAATKIDSGTDRSEEHTSELQSRFDLVCRLLLEKKKERNDVIMRA